MMLLGSIKVSGSIPVSDFFILFILVIKNLLFGQSSVRVHAFLWILPRLHSDSAWNSVKIRQTAKKKIQDSEQSPSRVWKIWSRIAWASNAQKNLSLYNIQLELET